MQLLHRVDTNDFETWKDAFDHDTEDRMNAGLTLLQMWHSADAAGTVFCLYEVNDRAKADAWLKKETALGDHASAGEAHFLRTA